MVMSASHKPPALGAHLHKHGATFRVWAPFAENVAVTGTFNDWQRTTMNRNNSGIWSVDIENAVAGQEYKFVIKNGDAELFKNDPRSLQLTTTGGNSVLVDTDYDWQNDDFTAPPMNEQVVYELHVGTFSRTDPSTVGTFDEAIKKLDHLAVLGINMIELMPINSMPDDRGWGYAPDYIYAVETLYGGRTGLLNFVRAAHSRGIGVVLDVVYNHLGPGDGLDMWQFDGWSENDKGGIYFYNDWRSSTPWGETRPDYGRKEVQDYILDNVAMWIADCHLDGLRLDSTIYLRNVKGQNDDPDNDLPEGWQLMQRITHLARKINSHALLVAEDVGANQYITETEGFGGAGFGAQWELSFPQVLRSALSPVEDAQRNLSDISNQLTKKFNSDVFRRIIYSDSHDSAANGSTRLSEQISPGNSTDLFARKRSILASTLVLTAPGIPMLFQGQEFNEGGSFNDWQELDWDKAEQFSGIVEAHQHLIALRKNVHNNTKGLSGQSINILHTDWDNHVLAYHRWMDGGAGDDVIVIINFSNQTFEDYKLHFPLPGMWQVRFNSSWKGYSPDFKEVPIDHIDVTDGLATIKLAPYSSLIFSQD
jgi:1,4-alpha-glucan branching enzyme